MANDYFLPGVQDSRLTKIYTPDFSDKIKFKLIGWRGYTYAEVPQVVISFMPEAAFQQQSG